MIRSKLLEFTAFLMSFVLIAMVAGDISVFAQRGNDRGRGAERSQHARGDRGARQQQARSDRRSMIQQRQSDARSRRQVDWSDRRTQRPARDYRQERAPRIVPFRNAREKFARDRYARRDRTPRNVHRHQPTVVRARDVWYESRRSHRGRDRRAVNRRPGGGPPPWAGVWNTPAPWVSNAPWAYNNRVSSRNVWRDRRTRNVYIWEDRRREPNRKRWFANSFRNHSGSWLFPAANWHVYEPSPIYISFDRPIHYRNVGYSSYYGYDGPYYRDVFAGDPYYYDSHYLGGGSPLGGLYGNYGDPYAHGGQNLFGGGIWDILLQTAISIFMGGSNYGYLDQQQMFASDHGYGYMQPAVYSVRPEPVFAAGYPNGYPNVYMVDQLYDPFGPQFLTTVYTRPHYGFVEPVAFVRPAHVVGTTFVSDDYGRPATALLIN